MKSVEVSSHVLCQNQAGVKCEMLFQPMLCTVVVVSLDKPASMSLIKQFTSSWDYPIPSDQLTPQCQCANLLAMLIFPKPSICLVKTVTLVMLALV